MLEALWIVLLCNVAWRRYSSACYSSPNNLTCNIIEECFTFYIVAYILILCHRFTHIVTCNINVQLTFADL